MIAIRESLLVNNMYSIHVSCIDDTGLGQNLALLRSKYTQMSQFSIIIFAIIKMIIVVSAVVYTVVMFCSCTDMLTPNRSENMSNALSELYIDVCYR